MRIAFSGASSTGKTTLAKLVMADPRSASFGSRFITTDARRLLRDLGHANIDEMDLSQRRELQHRYLERKLELEDGSACYLTDRSFIDVAAYWLEYTGASVDPESEFVGKCREESSKYDLHFYFPLGLMPTEVDGFRSTDTRAHRRTDSLILKLAACWDISLIRLETLDLDVRVRTVFDAVATSSQ